MFYECMLECKNQNAKLRPTIKEARMIQNVNESPGFLLVLQISIKFYNCYGDVTTLLQQTRP